MNGGIEGRPSIYGIWPTLGAGRPAVAGSDVFMPAGLFAGQENARHPAVARIIEMNREAGTQAIPGLLGTRLRQAGILTVLVTVGERERHLAAAAVMDGDGIIDSTLIRRDGFPGHIYPGLSPLHRTRKGALVVVDEDYVRQADEQSPPARLFGLSEKKAAALCRFDDELARQLDWPDGREASSLLIILSASGPGYRAVEHRTMCPVIICGPGVKQGMLTSASTRTAGLVASADIAPTVLAFFRLRYPEKMSGHVIQLVRDRHARYAAPRLARIDREVSREYWFTYPLVKAYVAWQVFVFGFLAWIVFVRRAAVERWRSLANALNLTTLSLPLALLLSPAFQAEGPWAAGVLAWALAALMGLVAWRLGGLRSLGLVFLWTAAVLLLDALTGGMMTRHSALGYNPATGLRFYGVGNEYMAIMLASAALGLGLWQQAERPAPWPFIAAAWAAMTLLLGASEHGANFGGSASAAFVLPFAVWPQAGGRPRGWQFLAGVLSMTAFAVAVVWLDMSRHPEVQSHIGQAARLVGGGGPAAALALLSRRLAIGLNLYRQIPLNLLGLVICLAAVAVVVSPAGRMRAVRERFPAAWSGLVAAAIAALAVTVLNDSGVVAGGAAMTIVLGGLLGLVLHASHEPHPCH
jgi:hypothetical protein